MDGTSFANPDAKYDLTNLISLALLCLPQLVSFFDQAYLALGFYFFMVGFFCFTAFSELLQRALCYSSIFRTILLVTGMYPDHSEQANESGIVDEPEKLHGYFYLSDGGYFESLGILQLIREGRKNIFCFDCLEDPNRRMSCLATVLDTAVSSGLIKDYEIEENPLDIVPRPVGGVLISNQRHLTITCTTHEGDKYTIFYCKVPTAAWPTLPAYAQEESMFDGWLTLALRCVRRRPCVIPRYPTIDTMPCCYTRCRIRPFHTRRPCTSIYPAPKCRRTSSWDKSLPRHLRYVLYARSGRRY